ncbi:MAG: hypothetical protein DRO88_14155 [Promethearchaeia archaeon]|nr:MAG: hypothetical protein DRO88_14155 [Candidatus Lokiarchaeia archaeon]
MEVIISHQSEVLFNRRYYDSGIINDNKYKEGIIHGIESLAANLEDEMLQFTLGTYTIVLYSKNIPFRDISEKKSKIHIYCIIDKNTKIETLRKYMKIILSSFTNRFSSFDIINHNLNKFTLFNKRVDAILGDLIYKSEDRFHNLIF